MIQTQVLAEESTLWFETRGKERRDAVRMHACKHACMGPCLARMHVPPLTPCAPACMRRPSRHAPLHACAAIQGVVLADFDTAFSKYHFTEFDNGTFVFIEPMVSAAVVLARALHALAAPPGAPPVVVSETLCVHACMHSLTGWLAEAHAARASLRNTSCLPACCDPLSSCTLRPHAFLRATASCLPTGQLHEDH
jgi:hypothetical protein